MSLATLTGEAEGEGLIGKYQSTYRQGQPYLQRNVRLVLRYLTMGSTISSLKTSAGLKTFGESPVVSEEDDDDEDIRPAKRRKTRTFLNTNGDSPYESESLRRKPFC